MAYWNIKNVALRGVTGTVPNNPVKTTDFDFFTEKDADIKELSKRYGVSCERIRQITRNFSQLYKKVENLWELFSSDFDLPVNEARFYRDFPCRKNNKIYLNCFNH